MKHFLIEILPRLLSLFCLIFAVVVISLPGKETYTVAGILAVITLVYNIIAGAKSEAHKKTLNCYYDSSDPYSVDLHGKVADRVANNRSGLSSSDKKDTLASRIANRKPSEGITINEDNKQENEKQ